MIFYPKLYVTIFLYHIYLSYVFLYLYILFTYLWIFFIRQYEYFAIHIFFARFFSKFCLPDLVSPVFVLFTVMSFAVSICVILDNDELFTVMSLVVSIWVIHVDDDESNNVKFVLIHMCDKWCETLLRYYITYHTLHCFWNHIYSSYVFISIHIYLCWRCIHWQGYWVWYILHAIGTVLLLSTSACYFGLSNDIPDVSPIFTSISVTSSVTFLVSSYCSQPEMYVTVFL